MIKTLRPMGALADLFEGPVGILCRVELVERRLR
jgi:hypothetical protein